MDITFELQTPDGKEAAALAKVIEARRREFGETTRQACVAIASNILRGLRVQTKVAKESQMDISVKLADDKYWPSFKKDSGSKGKGVAQRVLRQGPGGAVISPKKVVWSLGKYTKGQVAHSFEVEDKVSSSKVIQYIIVASSEREAVRLAKQFHRKRVKKHKSLAKHAISVAMKAIYDKGAPSDPVNSEVKSLAEQNVEASIRETGFSEGDVKVHVHDKLNYAALALQNASASVSTAVANAVNKTFGYIKSRVKANGGQIDKSLQMAVDQLVDKGVA